MNTRTYIQRLYRARLVLPSIPKRHSSAPAAQSQPPSPASPPQAPSPAAHAAAILSAKPRRTGGEGRQGAELPKTRRMSKYLVDTYQDGMVLGFSEYTDGKDERGLWTWSRWGVSLGFQIVNGKIWNSVMPHLWLRDNCRCSKCVNPDTMQRAFDTFSIPTDILPEEVLVKEEGLTITWANDKHKSVYPWGWLYKHRTQSKTDYSRLPTAEMKPVHFDARIVKTGAPSVDYKTVMGSDKGVGEWTTKIRKWGFCYVDNCPITPEATQALLERIAFIRPTHYGGFYDFTSDLTMKDTAYTSLALGPHTDTTYFTDPAGLQMFHLLSHTDGSGGESLLVDGFMAAILLLKQSPEAYRTLAETPIPWHASGNEGITVTPSHPFPVFNLSNPLCDEGGIGNRRNLLQVRWNNDDRGVVAIKPDGEYKAEKWYAAARMFDKILKSEDMQYWAQLEPGRPLIFDNWRVLHGRSTFTGKRRICGGYVNRDDFISRWRNTNFVRSEVLNQIL